VLERREPHLGSAEPGLQHTCNYATSNNRLASLTQSATSICAFRYDGAGNLITDSNGSTTYNYGYNNSGRLATLTVGSVPQSLRFCREYGEHKRDRNAADRAADCANNESTRAHRRAGYPARPFGDLLIEDNNLTTCATSHNSPQSRQN
jgi:YD repeat-containing protein